MKPRMSVARCCCPRGVTPPTLIELPLQTQGYIRSTGAWGTSTQLMPGVQGGLGSLFPLSGGEGAISFRAFDSGNQLPPGTVIQNAFFEGFNTPFWEFLPYNEPNPQWICEIYGDPNTNQGGLIPEPLVGGTTNRQTWDETQLPPGMKGTIGGVPGDTVQSPNVGPIIQEMITDPSWTAAGGDFHMFITPFGMAAPTTGDYGQFVDTGLGQFQPGNGWRLFVNI